MTDRVIVVLDDDPTGTQTVHDIRVYTDWEEETLGRAFAENDKMFFILTNSRSFSEEKTAAVHKVIGERICRAAKLADKDFLVISRGDSTLRGHYPLETETLKNAIEENSKFVFDGEVICPFFLEGNRITKNDIHYVVDGENYIPAGESEFARDATFGYTSSDLKDYVEEKTKGRYLAKDCISFSLEELKLKDMISLTKKLESVTNFGKIIVNAVSYDEIRTFCEVLKRALKSGHHYMLRTAAAIPKVLGEVTDKPLLGKADIVSKDEGKGGVVIVGSHVNKTNKQLLELKKLGDTVSFLEFDASLVSTEGGLKREADRITAETEKHIKNGRTVVIYTSRKVITAEDESENQAADKSLSISVQISDAFTGIIGNLNVRPGFIIAKGGITSSDVATKALRITSANVMGQIARGIPVWKSDENSKFPGLPYIIFPGNVGDADTLYLIVSELIG